MQEYERAVIFRLGRLLSGGSRGPGESMASRVKSSKVGSIALSIVFFSCRHLLRPALHRVLSEGRPEDHHAGGAAAGGERRVESLKISQTPY